LVGTKAVTRYDCCPKKCFGRLGHNAGVYDGLGIGALVKAASAADKRDQSKLSTVTNLGKETETFYCTECPSWNKHFVVAWPAVTRCHKVQNVNTNGSVL
jgi:hypothetical protein